MDDKELLRDDLRMDAYYYAFSETGQILVDRMLSSVALAGKAYHHTEFWSDDAEPWRSWQRGSSHVEFIQNAANDVAARLTALAEEVARLRGALEYEIKGAPTESDFEVGGRFDYDESCGNSGDVAKLYEARSDFERAKRIRAVLLFNSKEVQ